MRNRRMIITAVCVAALALLAFAGCGSQQQQSSSTASSKSSSSAPAYSLTIGDAKAGGGEFLLKNETQKGITGVKIKAAQDADFPAEALAMSTKTFTTGSVAQIYLPALAASDASSPVKAAIQFTCADGVVYTVHDVLVREIKEASLCVEGDVAYLKYTNANNNQAVNTLESEKALLAAAAPAAAVAATAATSDSGASEQKSDNQSNQSSSESQGLSDSGGSSNDNASSDDSGSNASNEAPASVDDSAVGGGAEADCIEDPVLKK